MKTKVSVIAAGALTGILALTACGGDTYEYEVSGPVAAKQIDYDCPNDLSLGLAAFGKSKRKSSGGGTVVTKKTPSKKPTPAAPKPTPSGSSAGTTGSKAPASTSSTSRPNTAHPKIALTTRPAKPHHITGGIPKPHHTRGGKGCETEYELFIGPQDDVYEQDVPADTYNTCAVNDEFPDCITQDD